MLLQKVDASMVCSNVQSLLNDIFPAFLQALWLQVAGKLIMIFHPVTHSNAAKETTGYDD